MKGEKREGKGRVGRDKGAQTEIYHYATGRRLRVVLEPFTFVCTSRMYYLHKVGEYCM